MPGKSEEKNHTSKFRYPPLSEFTSTNQKDSKGPNKRNVDPWQRRIDDFGPHCKYCGAHGEEWIIYRGSRDNERKGRVPRFYCKRCKRRFSRQGWGHCPLWIVSAILSLAVKGLGTGEIVDELKEEASRQKLDVKIPTRQTVSNIIERFVDAVIKLEEQKRRKCSSTEWQIDDTPQPFIKQLSSKQKRGDNRDFYWITNVFDVDNRYWLVAYVTRERDSQASIMAVQMALKRARGAPTRWRCDGLRAHIRAIKNTLPHAVIFSKTKAEKFEHINIIESLHSSMRRKGIKKRRKFRSLRTLQTLVDLVRVWHNFLRKFDSLDGITPAAKVGIAPVFRSWSEFVEYVYQHL
jgi:hypothetical protein